MVVSVAIRQLGLVLAALVLVLPEVEAVAREAPPAEARLRQDVAYLADDAREGRGPGTAGIEAAADYIAATFERAGLKPAEGLDGFFQPFEISGTPELGEPTRLTFRGREDQLISTRLGDDFTPLSLGEGGRLVDLPIVFAGYGITAQDESEGLDYDDYAGLDVQGKAVLILRREPVQGRRESPFGGRTPSRFATFQHKATNAFQHGAAAVLLVNDLGGLEGGQDALLAFNEVGPARSTKVPFLMLTRALADQLLAAAGQPNLGDLERTIIKDLKPASRSLEGWALDGEVSIERSALKTRNVVGVLEGAGPRADETIVVGAHYDHLGRGGAGSLAPGSHEIHNGADDNASGTAMLMEMVRRLAARPDPPARRLVFVAFSGEERGLLGSQYYVEHPPYPLDQTVAMMNFDMVGRLGPDAHLTLYGTGTAPGLEPLADAVGQSLGFDLQAVNTATGYFGASDHASFYRKDIPVLFFFTGTHPDYHKPTDDTETINFAGMARIADLAELLLLDLVRLPNRLSFTKLPTRLGSDSPGAVAAGTYLGTRPAYEEEVTGVKLDGVTEDSPAARAGLQAGDIIVGFAGKPIGTIQDFMEGLSSHHPGDRVEIVVRRSGQETRLQAVLGTRPRATGD